MAVVDLYSEDTMKTYKLQPRAALPPHIYCVAATALNALKKSNKPQCIIITGESGAGKTVTTQRLTQFLCNNSSNSKRIMERAFNALKILDIFGNAETPENRNSSRFVKFLQVYI